MWQALSGAGVRALLLKGPVLERSLYGGASVRRYSDVDLLVAPDSLPAAEEVLRELGFERPHPRAVEGEDPHAIHWLRGADPVWVDLHRTVRGVNAPDARVWEVLAGRTESIELFGVAVDTPGPGAIALLVVLHAAQHGAGWRRGTDDLDRAAAALPEAAWDEARELAERLDAVDAFAVGLRMGPATAAVADRLGLPTGTPFRVGADVSSQPKTTRGWYRLLSARGLRARIAIVRDELFPHPDFMRIWAPRAARTRAGLAAMYVLRPVWLVTRTPRALLSLRRARRAARNP